MDTPADAPRPRVGRPVDRSGDAAILAAALDLVAERDYDGMALDEVAARTGRAKTTIYRRWATKEDLVLAAIRSVGRPPEAETMPDTGSLRDDLLAVVDSGWLGGPDRRAAVFAGLAPAMRGSERLAGAIRSEVTDPYVEVYGRLLRRAIERGEAPARSDAAISLLAEVVPTMSTQRLAAGRGPVRREFFVAVIDEVLLPALGIR
ncbi:TetR/AcrR family transcriptional regulator [Clavibacter lycopersici]|uniref:TetR/AcrR family transcriptional regulator n=1 Tax=Clavibacter lycopersici TaxID=2301718 RepID=A0A399T2W0_9MICO|nr:TetR/AcrR family transcriptional regulator [Clavibacter lycopersici]RIJ48511.1 TetR/AcrR family transcriptional regulator [Clavibacter lycopersici]RIJ60623.1 TetR/AcrR family transcriptional regulator [Clavibacter lycopersici]